MVLTTARDVRCWPCYWLETKKLYKEEEFHVYDFLLVGDSRLCCWRFHSPSRPRQTKRQLSQRCTRDDFVTVEIAVSKVQIWKSRIYSSNLEKPYQKFKSSGCDVIKWITAIIGFRIWHWWSEEADCDNRDRFRKWQNPRSSSKNDHDYNTQFRNVRVAN